MSVVLKVASLQITCRAHLKMPVRDPSHSDGDRGCLPESPGTHLLNKHPGTPKPALGETQPHLCPHAAHGAGRGAILPKGELSICTLAPPRHHPEQDNGPTYSPPPILHGPVFIHPSILSLLSTCARHCSQSWRNRSTIEGRCL